LVGATGLAENIVNLSWRHLELKAFDPEVVPLGQPDAIAVYELAMSLCSRTRYGLDEAIFPTIERLDVEEEGGALPWLAARINGNELNIVFSRDDVFRVSTAFFLNNWQDMFCPSRNDVVIVPVDGGWVLFYSHEDEFEFTRL
jgi:hypothetical protein